MNIITLVFGQYYFLFLSFLLEGRPISSEVCTFKCIKIDSWIFSLSYRFRFYSVDFIYFFLSLWCFGHLRFGLQDSLSLSSHLNHLLRTDYSSSIRCPRLIFPFFFCLSPEIGHLTKELFGYFTVGWKSSIFPSVSIFKNVCVRMTFDDLDIWPCCLCDGLCLPAA